MAVQRPQDWVRCFEEYVNRGDMDKLMSLYENSARVVPLHSKDSAGIDGVRQMLTGLIASGTRLHGEVTRTTIVDDVAVIYSDWVQSSRTGNTPESRHKAIEVLRQQPDGSWKLIVGDPDGRT